MITRLFSTWQGLPRFNVAAMTPLEKKVFTTWKNIRRRCRDPKNPGYEDYGGRGINIPDVLHDDFGKFFSVIGIPPGLGHSIDRIDNDRGYEEGNMRWVKPFVQIRNRRNNINYQFEGKTQCLRDWATEKNMPYHTVISRWKRGVRGDVLFKKSANRGREAVLETIIIDGVPVTKSLSKWAHYAGLSVGTVIQRYNTYGWRGADIILPAGQWQRGAAQRLQNQPRKVSS